MSAGQRPETLRVARETENSFMTRYMDARLKYLEDQFTALEAALLRRNRKQEWQRELL